MDLASFLGLFGGIALIILGQILEHGDPMQLLQITAFVIVFGGTFGACFMSFPMKESLGSLGGIIKVFIRKEPSAVAVVEKLVELSTKARKEGIVSLEPDVPSIEDPFFKKALLAAIDGADPKDLKTSMEIEMFYMSEHAETSPKFWEAAGGYAPTIGILGAVIGLIQVMQNLDNIEEVGKGIAIAFVATIYGVGSSNMIFLPAANKLKILNKKDERIREMVLEGISLIVEGVNPMIIRDRLAAYMIGEAAPAKEKE